NRRAEIILSASTDRSIGLWEVSSGEKADFPFPEHKTAVHTIEWTDEEAYAITCSADHLRAMDGACLLSGWTPEMEEQINHKTGFTTAACSHHSTFLLAMASDNGTVLSLVSLLNANVLSMVRMKERVRCLSWSPATDLLAVGT